MTIRSPTPAEIVLEGTCTSEEAEVLLQRLLAVPEARVDVRPCESAHTAVVQVLMAANPMLVAPERETFAGKWLYSLLKSSVTD